MAAVVIPAAFIQARCLQSPVHQRNTRLPGLKPGPSQIVNGILDLALIWVNTEAHMHAAATEPEILTLVDLMNFDACWHIGQDHRSFGEDQFQPKKLRNQLVSAFENRTSVSYYAGFRPAWPPRPPRASHDQLFGDDVKLFSDLNRALDSFQTVRWGVAEHYGNHAYTGRLAEAVGLPSGNQIVNELYPGWSLIWRPNLPERFGTVLHRVSEEQAIFYIIGVVFCGVYRGHHGWHNLSGALAHGAEP
ncbi:hypothetical protein OQA88_3292 [Cercophora sp. LCS_1]